MVESVGRPAQTNLHLAMESAAEAHRSAAGPDHHEAVWTAMRTLKPFGSEALKLGLNLLGSTDPIQRAVACDLLGQLCNPDENGWGTEVAVALARLCRTETDPEVCWSIALALGRASDPVGGPALAELAYHTERDIRLEAARALPSCIDESEPGPALAALLGLVDDVDGDVRDWAMFGVGTQLVVDGHDVRDSLFRHTDDDHPEARDEAIVGIARRRDPRALPVVTLRLGEGSIGKLAIEAALYLADARLLPALHRIAGWWDVDPPLLESAIAACDPEQKNRRAALEEASIPGLPKRWPHDPTA